MQDSNTLSKVGGRDPALSQILKTSKYRRPDELCFDVKTYEEDFASIYIEHCTQQWQKFDRDCLEEWTRKCEKTYSDFEATFSEQDERLWEDLMLSDDS